MKYDPRIHHRRSIRLRGYDYRQAGGYFVTMVTQGREMLFGEIVNWEMILNNAGEMVVRWWLELPNKFPNTSVDVFIVMPNHMHGNIFIWKPPPVGVDPRVNPDSPIISVPSDAGGHVGPPRPNAPLSQMIQWFKTMTTNEYIRGVKQLGWKAFNGKVWQRDYYEHIIRSEAEADRIARYIEANPARWKDDNENPLRK